MKFTSRPRIYFHAAAVFSAAVLLFGLTPASPAQSTSPDDSEVVQLDVFEVKTRSEDNEYMQVETTTGTRIATKINDLSFPVTTITSEFLEDFQLFDPNGGDLANLSSSLSDVTIEGNYSLRGFESTYSLRDGFYRLGLNDRSSVDRVDIIKGPSAAMYGQTTPAGQVNYISKRPKGKNSVKTVLAAGTNDFYRGEVEANTILDSRKKVLNLFIAGASQSHSPDNEYGYTKTLSLFDSLVWKITDTAQLTAIAEYGKRDGTDAMINTMFFGPDIRTGSVDTVNKLASTFSQRGSMASKSREQASITLMFEKCLSRVFSFRVAGYYYHRLANQLATNTVGLNYFVDSQGRPFIYRGSSSTPGSAVQGKDPAITYGGEYWSRLTESGGAIQSDFTARYKIGPHINATSLLMVDFNDNRRQRLHREMSANRFAKIIQETAGIYTGNVVYIDNPDYHYYTPTWSDYTSVNRDDDTSFVDLGVFLRQQMFFFNDRLRFFAGIRFDNMHFNQTFGDQFTQAGDGNETYANYSASSIYSGPKKKYTSVFDAHATSPCIGLNYQYTKNAALYVNWSESFTPNAQNSQMGNAVLPNETGRGWDYGAKINFLDERCYITIGGFYIIRDGVKVLGSLDSVNADNPDFQAGGKHAAKGVEMDFNWRVGHGFTILGAYGYVNTEVLQNPNATNGGATRIVGRPTANIPQETGFLAVKYQFPRPLKGLSANMRVSYTGKSAPYSTSTSSGVTNATREWMTPSYALFNFGLGYQFKYAGVSHNLRMTIKNATDLTYIDKKGNYQGDGRTLVFSYTANF